MGKIAAKGFADDCLSALWKLEGTRESLTSTDIKHILSEKKSYIKQALPRQGNWCVRLVCTGGADHAS